MKHAGVYEVTLKAIVEVAWDEEAPDERELRKALYENAASYLETLYRDVDPDKVINEDLEYELIEDTTQRWNETGA